MAEELQACVRACLELQTNAEACVEECYKEAGWTAPAESGDIWMTLSFAAMLICLSGLFSGLTLGLMSLDMLGLEIIMEGGEPDERKHAAAIMPVRARGNLLLCTLLLGNTLVNALTAILLASLTSGIMGGIISTFVIVVFGEIIPQAACSMSGVWAVAHVRSRHGLFIGANTIWLVKFFILVTFPVSYPISICLDRILGRDIGTVYNPNELKKLINIHVENPDAAEESGLTTQDQRLLTGALEYKDKEVSSVMTGLDKVFMVEISARLNFQLMFSIYKSGFTRIPVYEAVRQNVVGILFVKDLILVDPDDEIEVRAILAFHGDRSAGYVKRVEETTTLDRVFKYFKSSYIHLLFVEEEGGDKEDEDFAGIKQDQDPRSNRITGIISLEDVLEAVIQDEIVDETDRFVDVNTPHATMVQRGKTKRDLSQFMSLFEHKLRKQTMLSNPEVSAISAYLTTNVKIFATWKDSLDAMKALIKCAELLEFREAASPRDDEDGGSRKDGSDSEEETSPRHDKLERQDKRCLYVKSKQTDTMVVVLQGKVMVYAGVEDFSSELGPWSVLGSGALTSESYIPDFEAEVQGAARLLLFRRAAYLLHLRSAQKALMESGGHHRSDSDQDQYFHRPEERAAPAAVRERSSSTVLPKTSMSLWDRMGGRPESSHSVASQSTPMLNDLASPSSDFNSRIASLTMQRTRTGPPDLLSPIISMSDAQGSAGLNGVASASSSGSGRLKVYDNELAVATYDNRNADFHNDSTSDLDNELPSDFDDEDGVEIQLNVHECR